MKKNNSIKIFLTIISLVFLTGCFVKDIGLDKPKNPNMAKRIAIVTHDNNLKGEIKKIESKFYNVFFENAKTECSNMNILKKENNDKIANLTTLPKLNCNCFDNRYLVPACRDLGLDAIILISFSGLESKQESKGFLWFKGLRNFLAIQVKIEIIDTWTGTKLLEEIFSEEVEIGDSDFSELTGYVNLASVKGIDKAIIDIASGMAKKIRNILDAERWKSYIAKKDGNKTLILAGKLSGLENGDILEAYESDRTIEGVGGQHFFIPGNPVGTLKITSVENYTSEAVILSGENIKEKSCVTIRNKE